MKKEQPEVQQTQGKEEKKYCPYCWDEQLFVHEWRDFYRCQKCFKKTRHEQPPPSQTQPEIPEAQTKAGETTHEEGYWKFQYDLLVTEYESKVKELEARKQRVWEWSKDQLRKKLSALASQQKEIEGLKERAPQMEYLFEFTSHQHWVNKAQGWFRSVRLTGHDEWLCLDRNGNACKMGADFRVAEEKGLYPVKCYRLICTADVK